jgi:hypothetical protein
VSRRQAQIGTYRVHFQRPFQLDRRKLATSRVRQQGRSTMNQMIRENIRNPVTRANFSERMWLGKLGAVGMGRHSGGPCSISDSRTINSWKEAYRALLLSIYGGSTLGLEVLCLLAVNICIALLLSGGQMAKRKVKSEYR